MPNRRALMAASLFIDGRGTEFQSQCRHYRTYRRLELKNGTDTAVHLSAKAV
jgi:hypothetical protein